MNVNFSLQIRKYKKEIKGLVQNKLSFFFNNLNVLKKNKNIIYLNNNIEKLSNYKDMLNHASIYFKSFGKNNFIIILYKNKIIYNKSIGQYKLNNIRIKKKKKELREIFILFVKILQNFFLKICSLNIK